jgi:hypothetical protein
MKKAKAETETEADGKSYSNRKRQYVESKAPRSECPSCEYLCESEKACSSSGYGNGKKCRRVRGPVGLTHKRPTRALARTVEKRNRGLRGCKRPLQNASRAPRARARADESETRGLACGRRPMIAFAHARPRPRGRVARLDSSRDTTRDRLSRTAPEDGNRTRYTTSSTSARTSEAASASLESPAPLVIIWLRPRGRGAKGRLTREGRGDGRERHEECSRVTPCDATFFFSFHRCYYASKHEIKNYVFTRATSFVTKLKLFQSYKYV